jgi:hypothetical protein
MVNGDGVEDALTPAFRRDPQFCVVLLAAAVRFRLGPFSA